MCLYTLYVLFEKFRELNRAVARRAFCLMDCCDSGIVWRSSSTCVLQKIAGQFMCTQVGSIWHQVFWRGEVGGGV